MPEVPQASKGRSNMATAEMMNSGGVLLQEMSLKHNYLSVENLQKGKMTYLTDGERASFDRSNVKESKQWVTEIILGQVFPVTRVSMARK